MRLTSLTLIGAVAVVLSFPAYSQTPDTTSPPAAHGFKAKRQAFVAKAKKAYFAVGCKILSAESATSLVNAESGRTFQAEDAKIADVKKDAQEAGLARASKPGQCDYFKRHPEEADALRNAAPK